MRDDPELAQCLTEMNTAITQRTGELREQITREQPAWTAGLGPRPHQPAAAAHWDELASLAAAYRETYNITSTDPAAPLGPQPDTAGANPRAWKRSPTSARTTTRRPLTRTTAATMTNSSTGTPISPGLGY